MRLEGSNCEAFCRCVSKELHLWCWLRVIKDEVMVWNGGSLLNFHFEKFLFSDDSSNLLLLSPVLRMGLARS